MARRLFSYTLRALVALSLAALVVLAPAVAYGENQTYYLGSVVNAGLNTGYSESNAITKNDPHFGWTLGQFIVSGYTEVQRSDDGSVTFLKTVGDQVVLSFRLDQDIDCLNGNENLTISNDEDGFDQEFGITKSEPGFGRGTLIIRQIDSQNASTDPQVYNDYLSGITVGANTEVELFEEGDYEVALDYEFLNEVRPVGGVLFIPKASIFHEYSNYTIRFKFSVRNGNAMAFLFDSSTGSELSNKSVTQNGFIIDLAGSRYLQINVKREVLANGDLDTRFNGPAEDGEQYTTEGVYTITATNTATGQVTEKIIYVGTDPTLKAYAVTGYSLDEIRDMVSRGATILEDGNIAWADAPASNVAAAPSSQTATTADGESAESAQTESADTAKTNATFDLTAVGVVIVLVAAMAGVTYAVMKKRKEAALGGSPAVASKEGTAGNAPSEQTESPDEAGEDAAGDAVEEMTPTDSDDNPEVPKGGN